MAITYQERIGKAHQQHFSSDDTDHARDLACRLYTLCERKKRAAEAVSYNGLVQGWPEMTRLAHQGTPATSLRQAALFQ